jgi:ABC-type transport system involved in cytochrome bd biosynthesis fused ATPase/permease subunit
MVMFDDIDRWVDSPHKAGHTARYMDIFISAFDPKKSGEIRMNQRTIDMIERARHYQMSPEERRMQRLSLTMGLRSAKSDATKEDVKAALEYMEGETSTLSSHSHSMEKHQI